MAENTILNQGIGGDTISTDDLGTYKVQRVKIMLGADGVNGGDVSGTNPVPNYFPAVTPVNISGTIVTGGTAQVLATANSARKGWWLRNNHATASIYVSDITTAVIGNDSLEIKAGELYTSEIHGCSGSALSIIAATAGHGFTARSW